MEKSKIDEEREEEIPQSTVKNKEMDRIRTIPAPSSEAELNDGERNLTVSTEEDQSNHEENECSENVEDSNVNEKNEEFNIQKSADGSNNAIIEMQCFSTYIISRKDLQLVLLIIYFNFCFGEKTDIVLDSRKVQACVCPVSNNYTVYVVRFDAYEGLVICLVCGYICLLMELNNNGGLCPVDRNCPFSMLPVPSIPRSRFLRTLGGQAAIGAQIAQPSAGPFLPIVHADNGTSFDNDLTQHLNVQLVEQEEDLHSVTGIHDEDTSNVSNGHIEGTSSSQDAALTTNFNTSISPAEPLYGEGGHGAPLTEVSGIQAEDTSNVSRHIESTNSSQDAALTTNFNNSPADPLFEEGGHGAPPTEVSGPFHGDESGQGQELSIAVQLQQDVNKNRETESSSGQDTRSASEQGQGVGQGDRRVRHPQLSTTLSRLATFKYWPNTTGQSPNQLAEAGLFHAGKPDSCRCFTCNGGLRNWGEEDDPWLEHARWFPHCQFVINTKGQAYVDMVQAAKQAAETSSQLEDEGSVACVACEALQTLRDHVVQRLPHTFDVCNPITNGKFELFSYDISRFCMNKDPMRTEAAKEVQAMGYSNDAVMQAIEKFKREYPNRHFTAEELIKILKNDGTPKA